MRGKRYELWWSGNDNEIGDVGILVEEELFEKVVEIQKQSNRVMEMVLVFEEEVLRVICTNCILLSHWWEDQSAKW